MNAPIKAPQAETPATDGTLAIYKCRSDVKPNDLEPPDSAHLTAVEKTGEIPAGNYFFLQGFTDTDAPRFLAEALANPDDPASASDILRQAAKELWLESLWQEIQFAGQTFFLRILEEGGHCVFQIFRETA